MPSANLLSFTENFDTMTFPECFAFIERTQRQIGMLMQAPNITDDDRQTLASVHLDLNALETDLRSNPNCP